MASESRNELVEKQVIFEGRKVRLEVHRFRDEAGKTHFKEVCVHPGAVVILPMLDENTVVLIRNWRYTVDQKLVELPAGTLERGEMPINCAGRELLEETGYLAKRMQPLISFFSSPGILTEKMHVFVATELVVRQANTEPGEEIEVTPTSWSEAIEMIGDGRIQDSKTISTLLYYDRFRKK